MPSKGHGPDPYSVTVPEPPLTSLPPSPSHRNKRFGILIGINVLVVILVGSSVFALFSQRARGNVTNASTAPVLNGSPLYTADWSSGLSGWTGTSDWRVADGMLRSDGTDSTSNSPTIVAPYQVEGRTDYAVEANMQVEAGIGCFDVTTMRATGLGNVWQGYKVTICGGKAEINAGNIAGISYDSFAHVSFDAGNVWHTYRFEARGTMLSLMIDSKLALGVNDSRYASGGKLGFKSSATRLNVGSFKVFAL
jgi:hypothetical protein